MKLDVNIYFTKMISTFHRYSIFSRMTNGNPSLTVKALAHFETDKHEFTFFGIPMRYFL